MYAKSTYQSYMWNVNATGDGVESRYWRNNSTLNACLSVIVCLMLVIVASSGLHLVEKALTGETIRPAASDAPLPTANIDQSADRIIELARDFNQLII